MKELAITDPADLAAGYTSIRVLNFWLDGATGDVQAVLVKCKGGTPDTRTSFDMPRQKLDEGQLDGLLEFILKHGQQSDNAKKAEREAEIAAIAERNAADKDAADEAAKKKDPAPEIAPYERVLPDGAIKAV